MSTENIVKNRYYRILKDKTNAIWDRISFWTHADDVELTGGATLSSDLTAKQTKIDATQSDFAQVETSPTTHAYIRGQMLIYNNQLYRVKANIAVGATLTVETNIEAVSVSTLSSMLTATNGNGFYFDVKDGTPGFYPTASKTASEFVPFGGTIREGVLTRVSGDTYQYSGIDEPFMLGVYGHSSQYHCYNYIDGDCYRDGATMTYTLDMTNKHITFNGSSYITTVDKTYCYGK